MPPEDPAPSARPPIDLVSVLAVAAILAVIVAGWLLFPAVMRYMQRQDCVAVGHTNCE